MEKSSQISEDSLLVIKKICDTITMDFDISIENKSGLGTAGRGYKQTTKI